MRKLILLTFLFVSCGSLNLNKKSEYVEIPRDIIAILPFDNNSNDITAETLLRDLVAKGFERKGFVVIKNEIVDEKLKTIGISDGGQLKAVNPGAISELLGVRYLLYGTINDFKLQNIGYIVKKKVELEVKIIDTQNNNQEIFNQTGEGSDLKVFLKSDEAKKAFIEYNALKLVENIMKRPLYNESKEAVDSILSKIR